MMRKNAKLVREQLERTLRPLGPLRNMSRPHRGWIRAIRDALGMNGRQLADRLGDHRSRTEQLERQELAGSLTLKTMNKVAEALDCVFVYGLVPRSSLEETVYSQAKRVAWQRLARASHTMGLEDQALGKKEDQEILSDMIREIVDETPSSLWDQ